MRYCCSETFSGRYKSSKKKVKILGQQIKQVVVRLHLRGWRRCETAPASLLLWGNAVNCVDASSRRWRRPCKWPCLLCRNLQCKLFKVFPFFLQITYSCPLGTGRYARPTDSRQSSSDTRLWSAHWKLEVSVQLNFWRCHSPKLIVDGFVLHYTHAGHLFQNTLSAERLEPINLKFWIPDIPQSLRGLVHFLRYKGVMWCEDAMPLGWYGCWNWPWN